MTPDHERYMHDRQYYLDYAEEYRKKYPEKVEAMTFSYYARNRKQILEKAHFDYLDKRQEILARAKKRWREKHPKQPKWRYKQYEDVSE